MREISESILRLEDTIPKLRIPDNETDLHFILKMAAMHYLGETCDYSGFEVDVAGWIIDAVGVKVKFGKTYDDIENYQIKFIEAKASRADFLREFKQGNASLKFIGDHFRRYAHQCYVICPEGLIQPEELPKGWGLLWVAPNNSLDTHDDADLLLSNRPDLQSPPRVVCVKNCRSINDGWQMPFGKIVDRICRSNKSNWNKRIWWCRKDFEVGDKFVSKVYKKLTQSDQLQQKCNAVLYALKELTGLEAEDIWTHVDKLYEMIHPDDLGGIRHDRNRG